jgi:hypothetical protein
MKRELQKAVGREVLGVLISCGKSFKFQVSSLKPKGKIFQGPYLLTEKQSPN